MGLRHGSRGSGFVPLGAAGRAPAAPSLSTPPRSQRSGCGRREEHAPAAPAASPALGVSGKEALTRPILSEQELAPSPALLLCAPLGLQAGRAPNPAHPCRDLGGRLRYAAAYRPYPGRGYAGNRA